MSDTSKIRRMANKSHRATLLRFAKRKGIFRASEAHAAGVPWAYLGLLTEEGALLRLARGLYAHPDYEPGEHASLAETARLAPSAVICLLSALRFHDLTTQNPFEVWLMIESRARRPSIRSPKVRVVRASGRALRAGVETHRIDGTRVKITSVPKTVCDCFRYRSKVGLDVAVEALRDALGQRRTTVDELQKMADIDRVTRVMQPYLESHRSSRRGPPYGVGAQPGGSRRRSPVIWAYSGAASQPREPSATLLDVLSSPHRRLLAPGLVPLEGLSPTREGLGPWETVTVETGGALFDTEVDSGETNDLAADEPGTLAELEALLERIRRSPDRGE